MPRSLPLAVHYATHVRNGWMTFDEVPAEYREAVSDLVAINLTEPVPPIVNHVFDFKAGSFNA